MDQKMKNFDRSIEQMMNESAVTPPFGMWNRISAELGPEVTPVPVSVNSPIPQRTIAGFIAAAVLIGASLVTAYVVNDLSNKENKAGKVTTVTTQQAPVIAPVATEAPVVTAKLETKPVVHSSKPTSIAKPVEEKITPAETAAVPAEALRSNTEVSVPNQTIAENNVVNEPYFFPAIDIASQENKPTEKVVTPVTKAKVETKNSDDNDREVVSNDPPRIKFHPKKHRSFSYGKIIRRR